MENRSVREKIISAVRSDLIPTAVLAGIWVLLGWIYNAGVYNLFFRILAFLTGSVNGLFGSTLGGLIGRTLLALCLHDLVRELFMNRGSFGSRFRSFLSSVKSDLLEKIPQYLNIKYFYEDRDLKLLGCGLLGCAAAIWLYPLITADGELINSSVLLLLFFTALRDAAGEGGFVKALLHFLKAKSKIKKVSDDMIDRLLAGFALGSALSFLLAVLLRFGIHAVFVIYRVLLLSLPWILAAGGIGAILYAVVKKGKENA